MFAFCRAGALTDMGRIDEAIAALRDAAGSFKELGIPVYAVVVACVPGRARWHSPAMCPPPAWRSSVPSGRDPRRSCSAIPSSGRRGVDRGRRGRRRGARAAALDDAAAHLESGRLIAAARCASRRRSARRARAGRRSPGGTERGDGRRRRSGVRGARARPGRVRRTGLASVAERYEALGCCCWPRRHTRAPPRRSSPTGDPRAPGARAPGRRADSPGARAPGRPRSPAPLSASR